MGDLSATIVAKSDQLNADDLVGGPITILVTDAVVNAGDQPLSIFYEGHNGKPYKPSKGMRRLMMMAWDTDESKDLIGKTMTLYREPTVLWAGEQSGGIRISHLSHIDEELTFPIMVKRGKRERITVKPLATTATHSFTIDDARHRLSSARTLDELSLAWRNKAMAPFRDALAGYLEQRKAELSQSDQSPAASSEAVTNDDVALADGQQEEADAGAASDIPAQIAQTTFERLTDLALTSQNAADIDAVEAEFDARESEIMLADRPTLQATINDARDRILKGE